MKSNSIDIRKKFGQRIRVLRAEAKLSQEDLAFSSNLDRTYISGIERGVRNPSLVNINKIAQALKVEPSELFLFDKKSK